MDVVPVETKDAVEVHKIGTPAVTPWTDANALPVPHPWQLYMILEHLLGTTQHACIHNHLQDIGKALQHTFFVLNIDFGKFILHTTTNIML